MKFQTLFCDSLSFYPPASDEACCARLFLSNPAPRGGGEGKASRLGAILLSLYEEDCYPPESEQELLSLVEGLRAERREELERKRLDGLSLKPQEEATRLLQGYAESRKRMFERKKGRKG